MEKIKSCNNKLTDEQIDSLKPVLINISNAILSPKNIVLSALDTKLLDKLQHDINNCRRYTPHLEYKPNPDMFRISHVANGIIDTIVSYYASNYNMKINKIILHNIAKDDYKGLYSKLCDVIYNIVSNDKNKEDN